MFLPLINFVSSLYLCSPVYLYHYFFLARFESFLAITQCVQRVITLIKLKIGVIMKRNCQLDLRFHPSSGYSPSHHSMKEPLNTNKQLVAIHHNRRHIFDITEFQARVIIWLASQEMKERTGSTRPAPTTSLSLQSQALFMHAPPAFSIKRSLRNFLQKRKRRSQSHISVATHNSNN